MTGDEKSVEKAVDEIEVEEERASLPFEPDKGIKYWMQNKHCLLIRTQES